MGDVIYLNKKRKEVNDMVKETTKSPIVISHVNNVARTFLSFESMNPKKLQKLCYYAYSILLSHSDGKIKLFDTTFEAWIHGPVAPALYDEYRKYEINELIPKGKCPNKIKNNTLLYNYICSIFERYGKYDADILEEMTHRESPWQNARKGLMKYEYSNNTINDDDIVEYYKY